MNKDQINSIGKYIFIAVLVLVVLYTGNQCWVENEGGHNWGPCGVSFVMLVIVAGCVYWGFQRIKKEQMKSKKKKK